MRHRLDRVVATPSNKPNPRADWFAWILHFIVGLLVGASLGWFMAMKMLDSDLLGLENLITCIGGVALVIGAASSHFGNRLWIRSGTFEMEEPPRSRASGLASLVIGITGAVLVVVSVVLHLDEALPAMGKWHFDFTDAAVLPVVALLIGLLVYALRTDTLITPYAVIDRYEHPVLFWFFLTLEVVSLIGAVVIMLRS